MKKKLLLLSGAVLVVALGLIIWQVSKPKTTSPGSASKTAVTQVLPVTSNPIQNTSAQSGLVIKSAAAEDNTDPATKQAIADRLQVTVQNTSAQTMSNMEVYYSMKDKKTGQVESYYQKLNGLQLAPNETKTIAFDGAAGVGHYPENKYSLYRSSQNQVDFTIEVSAPGFKPATATALKSAGTGETAG
jgi:hypothetical protein